jgi:WD40 repeat protein
VHGHGHGSPTCFDIDAGRLDVAVDESLTGERDGDLTVWANGTGHRLRSWSANERAIDAVSFLPSRALAASAGEDRTIRVWRTDTGKLVSERRTVGFATAVALS